MTELVVIDLCAGAGGWACAARGLPVRVALAVDWAEPPCITYRLNHPGVNVLQGDLRDEAVQRAVLHEARRHARAGLVVLGGIPCEWLSSYRVLIAVGAKELAAQQATLDACLGLVKAIGPRWWCMEDVAALVKHLPLMTPFLELNSRRYSAQRRKRVYVGDFPPPAPGDCKDLLRDKIRPGPYRIGRRSFERTPQLARTFNKTTTLAAPVDAKSPTVCNIGSRRDAEVLVVDDSLPGGKRQFEWQEMAALQGFPEDYLFYGSPTDVADQVGRAVQVDTGRAILTAMCRAAGLLARAAAD